ncbi:2,3-bisphosphoglycerate-dependent phosphoglycerate mutase [Dyadobacter sp. CECT 9275]|uniref:2,3-bisphosphoglycerate-dependent phosphoglycerate mutase n=1 Tax=Dyadobacter helix TaxID=2822344 RepID=A0A916JBR6_9BACT|nr:histidine phosphatase family protein [Dyadobacter sp. CECT 9275]CAG5002671.1 2,3-bisphosphoglycerate-dependent phosphoglycerate mutase [Dyadobacter sp. CECT 9275]
MKRKSIYLIRHGETDLNRRGVVQGSGVNAPLNEWGEAQAEAFFNAYQHVPFDKIYTSDLLRTHQSVRGFLRQGIPHESYAGLNEISWGVREGKEPNTGDSNYYRELVTAWRNGEVHLAAEEGESPVDVRNRQIPVIETILSRPHERNILVAMHGRAMRVFLTILFNQPLVRMDDYEHSNLCLYKINYSYDKGQFDLEISNDITHLLSLEIPQTL